MMHSLLAAYARWKHRRELSLDWETQQRGVLGSLMHHARGSQFFSQHDLQVGLSVKAYQANVPLRRFQELHADYLENHQASDAGLLTDRPVKFLLESSGTTSGITRSYPLTMAGLRGFQKTASAQVLSTIGRLGHARPMVRPFLSLSDYRPLREVSSGVYQGPITDVLASTVPWFVQRKSLKLPGRDDSIVDKMRDLVAMTLKKDIGVLTGMTSWLLRFVEMAKLETGKASLREIWPTLQVIGHGGVPAHIYADTLNAEFGEHSPPFILAESYAASEGYIAFGDALLDGALRLSCHNGIFYEFIPREAYGQPNPPRLGVHEVVEGQEYAIALTTPSGLWSHIIGDVVKFTHAKHKTLEVVGRLTASIEVWNEHLTESDLDLAVRALSREHGLTFLNYHLGPRPYDDASGRGSYRFIFALEDGSMMGATEIGERIDRKLADLNHYYKKIRLDGGLLDPPEVYSVKPQFFEAWLAERPGGTLQRKVPRVEGTGKVAAELVERLKAQVTGAA